MTPAAEARAAILRASRDRSPYTLNTHVAALGAITGWRTCTPQQLAAFVGDPRLARHLSHPAATLFDAGLIETTAPSLWASDKARDLQLYRPASRETFAQLSRDLTWAEWIGVTGGQPYGGGGHHDRHNVFAAELGLRLAEYTDIAAVLGEPFSTHSLLIGDGVGRPHVKNPGGADLTAVRTDGLRIAIELTSTTSPHFDAKVERVAKALASGPLKHTGLVVIFVVAPSVSTSARHHAHVLQETRSAIAKACRRHPGDYLDLTRDRIGVATWRAWFPAEHTAAGAFFTLRAERITRLGNSVRGDEWETVDFLSPEAFPFAPHNPEAMREIIANAGMLGQTPHWKRTEPVGDPEEAQRSATASSKGRGVASSPKIPSRLLGLGTSMDMARLGRNVRVHYDPASTEASNTISYSASEARRLCSAALLRVTQGQMTMDDLLREAAQGGSSHPYWAISLKQLLLSQPGVGSASAERFLRRVVAFLGTPSREKMTVGWLVDKRTAHRRERAWQEASRELDVHGGFPWASLPPND